MQVSETDGIAPSRDGYVIGAPGLHEVEGVVYRYLRNGRPAPCPREMYELLVERGEQAREQAWIDVNAGEPIAEGSRNESIFHLALELVREGKAKAEILARLLVVNREQCRPPLAVGLVREATRRRPQVGTRASDPRGTVEREGAQRPRRAPRRDPRGRAGEEA